MSIQELEALSKKINGILDDVQGANASAGDVRSKQKRSIMILQQFYKLLLSDFSPADWMESKAYLRSNGFPSLRDALKIKPSKLPEKLRKGFDKYDGPEERRRQLESILERLEEAVNSLDDAIFASAKLSKKAEKAAERLESIGASLDSAVALIRKKESLSAELGRAERLLPLPDGGLDIEKEAREKHNAAISAAADNLERQSRQLRIAETELVSAMERFKKFLAGSGRHLSLLVVLLPSIREITGPYVKFDSAELTDWEISVAVKNYPKYRSKLPDGHALLRSEEEDTLDALRHLMDNREAIADYNRIRYLQEKVASLKTDVEKCAEEKVRVEGQQEFAVIRSGVEKKGEESRREFLRLKSQLEGIDEELREVMSDIGSGEDGDISQLTAEVEGLLSQLE